MDPEAKGDVLDLKVTMDRDKLTGFDFTVNNWDDKHFAFKYSDTKTFDLGNRVHIRMGYADDLRFMASGFISALAPKFPESGPPTLAVTGVDAMAKLRRKPVGSDVKKFVDMADWQIAQVVAARNKIDIKVSQVGPRHPVVVQENQDDALFLVERANIIDFDCYIGVDPDTGHDTLYFTSEGGRDGRTARIYVFEWGKSLINFNPVLSTADQVSKVTVRGWNSRTKTAISYTAGPDDLLRKAGRRQYRPGGRREDARRQAGRGHRPLDFDRRRSAQAGDQPDPRTRAAFSESQGPGHRPARFASGRSGRIAKSRQTLRRYLRRQRRDAHAQQQRIPHRIRSGLAFGWRNQMNMAMSPSGSTELRYYGVYEALVSDVNDPAKEGRVKIKIPWFDPGLETEWCRVRQFYAGNGYGAFYVPECGDEVLIAFIKGSMSEPVILGGLYNGSDKPPSHRDDQTDQKMLRTKAGHEFLLDNSPGKERVRITTKLGHTFDLSDADRDGHRQDQGR